MKEMDEAIKFVIERFSKNLIKMAKSHERNDLLFLDAMGISQNEAIIIHAALNEYANMLEGKLNV